ncbi:MAG TPA: DNA-3-methyladenine glycosylase [Anaerolineae bacterium]|nr:DNA-3-methyladenine glycosylase [Anaerolineae bacterium]
MYAALQIFTSMSILPQSFFSRPTLTVARDLLGQRLVRDLDGQRLSGIIVETEAYIGPDDTASHASRGRTARTAVMFGPAGQSYVYFVYGMHYMLNVVTEMVDFPAAVLIRALEPVEGMTAMEARRRSGRRVLKPEQLTNGPAKLCQALGIDRGLNNISLTTGKELWIEPVALLPPELIRTGPRVGIDYANHADRLVPWRFWLKHNRFVSRVA